MYHLRSPYFLPVIIVNITVIIVNITVIIVNITVIIVNITVIWIHFYIFLLALNCFAKRIPVNRKVSNFFNARGKILYGHFTNC